MRRVLMLGVIVALVGGMLPAAALTKCSYSASEPNPSGCVMSACADMPTTRCDFQRTIVSPLAGRLDPQLSYGTGPGTYPADCRSNPTPDNCTPVTAGQAQSYVLGTANCASTFNPTTNVATKCLNTQNDTSQNNVGTYVALRRRDLEHVPRCVYQTDDRTQQDHTTGRLGYVIESQIPVSQVPGKPSWEGRYFKLEAVGNPTADFDMRFFTVLGSCSNRAILGEEPQWPTDDLHLSSFAKPGNESGRIPFCVEQRPPTNGCSNPGVTYWYSVVVTLFSGPPNSQFKFTVCPTSNPC